MALRFFRKRQKMVLVIMVVLMFAFLLSSVIPSFFQPEPGKTVIGSAGELEITANARARAHRHIQLLRSSLGLGQFRPPRTGEAAFVKFLELNDDEESRALAWALLVGEARQMGLEAGELQARSFMARSGLAGRVLQQEVANLGLSGYTERDLIRAAEEYLDVIGGFLVASPAPPPTVAGLPQAPPSRQELRHLGRDLSERVQLAVASFPAGDFTAGLAEPADDQVQKQFDDRKHLLPAHPTNRTEFGFGYRQPARADVRWLLVDYEPLLKAVDVPEGQMIRYWRQHQGQMKRWEKVPAPSTAAATSPATRPAEPQYRQVLIKDYVEAVPEIRRLLKPEAAEAKAAQLLRRARELILSNTRAKDPYAETVKAMIRPADALLKKELPRLPAIAATLAETIEQLEGLWGVKIIYPLGTHGKFSLDGELQVKLKKRPAKASLGEVLKEIQGQLDYPEIQWVVCEKLPGAVFPSRPVNLAPVSAGRSGMLRREEIRAHEILGSARRQGRGGHSVDDVLASVRAFQGPEPTHRALIDPGKDFREPMHVEGERRGRLLWRLLAAKGEHEPEALTEAIRRQVVADLRVAGGFARAQAAAGKTLKDLAAGDLEKLAKDRKLRFRKTEPFARKQIQPWVIEEFVVTDSLSRVRAAIERHRGRIPLAALQEVAQGIRFRLQRIEMFHRMDPRAETYMPPRVLEVAEDTPATGLDIVEATEKVVVKAFELAPKDPASPGTDRPAAVVGLPRLRTVLLIQRVGYEIPTEREFRAMIDPRLKPLLYLERRQQSMREWFAAGKIRRRMGYKPVGPPGGAAGS